MKRVRGHGRGEVVFTWKDFQDLGARGSIDVALHRLAKAGKLRRVGRGMYDLPRASKLLRGPAPASTNRTGQRPEPFQPSIHFFA